MKAARTWGARQPVDVDGLITEVSMGVAKQSTVLKTDALRSGSIHVWPGKERGPVLVLPSRYTQTQGVASFAQTGLPSYAGITSETYVGTERRQPGAVEFKGDWQTARQYIELRKGTGTISIPSTPVR